MIKLVRFYCTYCPLLALRAMDRILVCESLLSIACLTSRYRSLFYDAINAMIVSQWDRALLEMTVGEKSEVVIEPEWAYGKAGKPEAK